MANNDLSRQPSCGSTSNEQHFVAWRHQRETKIVRGREQAGGCTLKNLEFSNLLGIVMLWIFNFWFFVKTEKSNFCFMLFSPLRRGEILDCLRVWMCGSHFPVSYIHILLISIW
jgi:hypothetical protein